MAYVNAPIPVDPDELEAEVISRLQDRFPDWQPAEGNLDTWIIRAFCQRAAIIGESVTDVLRSIFRYFGTLAGIPPTPASQAVGTSTWTVLSSTSFQVIPEGEPVAFTGADGDPVAFVTTSATTIPPGTTTVADVALVASEAGEAGNDLEGSGTPLGGLDFVVGVELDSATEDGGDAEDDDAYLDRLAEELRLMSPRWIKADEAAILARRVPEVSRALAIDNFDPTGYNAATGTGGTDDAEGIIALCLIDSSGVAVSTASRDEVTALLNRTRGVNCNFGFISPTYTSIAVVFTITPWADFDAAAVVANAETAVASYLDPGVFGQPDFGDSVLWVAESKVRFLEVAQVIQSVEGVRYLDSLTLNGGTADVNLLGRAPLPHATPAPSGSVTS